MFTQYSPEEAESLPWIKNNMDNGTQPFIRDQEGRRWGFTAESLQEVGFLTGQSLSHEQLIFLLETNLAKARMQLALAEAGYFPKE